MIKGVGTDIIEIERLKNAKENFYNSVFTKRELDKFHGFRYNSLAGIFAAKEAVAKALGTGFMGFSPKDIEIAQDEKGKPVCLLHNNALERLKEIGGENIYVSISHNKSDAIAYAVIE
ncbi:MAG: holo-ACP synthase [Firmicutes bacterium]|nr:holo-ACP synthase [Bacillota bacterium]